MNRSNFLKSIFAIAVAAAIKDASILKLAEPGGLSPGIDGKLFTVKFGRDWFRQCDIMVSRNGTKWFFQKHGDGARLYRIPAYKGEPGIEYINVEFIDDVDYEADLVKQAEQLYKYQLEHSHRLVVEGDKQEGFAFFKPVSQRAISEESGFTRLNSIVSEQQQFKI
jgi:hypothetical protein